MNILQIIAETLKILFPWALAMGLIFGLLMVFLSTHKNSGMRGVITYIGHLSVLALGWLLGKWIGIFLISLPILAFFYYMLFHLAMVVVPAATPENWFERWQRFRILLWYRWGFQYPLWMITDLAGRNIEMRIPGNAFMKFFGPGLIWAPSHQVVGLTTGLAFSGIRGAGAVFTGAFERPFSVVDLRTQLRTSLIDVVSSDGIPYKAQLFTSFAVDKTKWPRDLYHRLYSENHRLKDAKEPDYVRGSYPFSRSRVRALFATIGVSSHLDEEPKTLYWDERVLYQIEEAAREVLSQRTIDQLWLSQNDRDGVNALDNVANAIKEQCSFQLRRYGVHLYTCRIVELRFLEQVTKSQNDKKNIKMVDKTQSNMEEDRDLQDSDIEAQQITTWRAVWERNAAETRADAKARAEHLLQETRARVYANLLTNIVEALERTRQIDPDLPRHVIALRFFTSLEDFIRLQPEGEEKKEAQTMLSGLRQTFPPGIG